MKKPIYLDYAAATPTDPRVIDVMVNCLKKEGAFANPHAKDHVYGWEAAEAVENARSQIADLVGCSPLELTFTSGATEANNLAIFGLAHALKQNGDKRNHIITSKIEHKAVLEACEVLEKQGYKVTYLTPREDGITTIEDLEAALSDDTFLVSLAQANSVLGSVNDVHALSSLCKKRNIYFHTDTAQSAGFEKTDFMHSDISLATLTSEKVCGPKGVGALYIKKSLGLNLVPEIYGGGQEKGLRGGTVPTHQVAGMGEAFEILRKEGESEKKRLLSYRELLIEKLSTLPNIIINGSSKYYVPHILSVSFKDIDAHMLLPTLSNIAVSTGSACASSSLKPSYILTAIGRTDDEARSSLRISFGRFTTKSDIECAIEEILQKIPKLYKAGSMWTVKGEPNA